jgi:hypothetical protein
MKNYKNWDYAPILSILCFIVIPILMLKACSPNRDRSKIAIAEIPTIQVEYADCNAIPDSNHNESEFLICQDTWCDTIESSGRLGYTIHESVFMELVNNQNCKVIGVEPFEDYTMYWFSFDDVPKLATIVVED